MAVSSMSPQISQQPKLSPLEKAFQKSLETEDAIFILANKVSTTLTRLTKELQEASEELYSQIQIFNTYGQDVSVGEEAFNRTKKKIKSILKQGLSSKEEYGCVSFAVGKRIGKDLITAKTKALFDQTIASVEKLLSADPGSIKTRFNDFHTKTATFQETDKELDKIWNVYQTAVQALAIPFNRLSYIIKNDGVDWPKSYTATSYAEWLTLGWLPTITMGRVQSLDAWYPFKDSVSVQKMESTIEQPDLFTGTAIPKYLKEQLKNAFPSFGEKASLHEDIQELARELGDQKSAYEQLKQDVDNAITNFESNSLKEKLSFDDFKMQKRRSKTISQVTTPLFLAFDKIEKKLQEYEAIANAKLFQEDQLEEMGYIDNTNLLIHRNGYVQEVSEMRKELNAIKNGVMEEIGKLSGYLKRHIKTLTKKMEPFLKDEEAIQSLES